MNRSSTPLRKLAVALYAAALWMVLEGIATAAEASSGGGGGGAQSYVLSYFLLVLCIGLGLLFVCRSARRRDKPRGEAYEIASTAEVKKVGGVPVITVGMRVDQVNKLLGKPTICRRGDEIYREAAQAGQLPEEEAAKEYSVYEHAAGRYEVVALDRRIVQIKKQPKSEKDVE